MATSSVSFFRSVGGSVGVALSGALFNSRLVAHLLDAGPAVGLDPSAVRPETLQTLPVETRTAFVEAFAAALTDVFRYALPVVVLGFVLSWLLKEIPLRSSALPASPEGPELRR